MERGAEIIAGALWGIAAFPLEDERAVRLHVGAVGERAALGTVIAGGLQEDSASVIFKGKAEIVCVIFSACPDGKKHVAGILVVRRAPIHTAEVAAGDIGGQLDIAERIQRIQDIFTCAVKRRSGSTDGVAGGEAARKGGGRLDREAAVCQRVL